MYCFTLHFHTVFILLQSSFSSSFGLPVPAVQSWEVFPTSINDVTLSPIIFDGDTLPRAKRHVYMIRLKSLKEAGLINYLAKAVVRLCKDSGKHTNKMI